MKKLVITFGIATVLVAGFAIARQIKPLVPSSSVKISAAIALTLGKPEVRIRWQYLSGWIPSNGVLLYKIEGKKKTLIFTADPPKDTEVDAKLAPQFRGKAMVSQANANTFGIPKLDMSISRPPTSEALFNQKSGLLSDLKSLDTPLLTSAQRANRQQKVSQLSNLKTRSIGKVSANNLTSAQRILQARSQLTLASLVNEELAQTLAMGATDKTVQSGDKVSYELYERNSKGAQGDLIATVPFMVVGSDSQPPSVGGFTFLQEESRISMRWNRVPASVEENLLAVSYMIRRKGPGLGASQFSVLTENPLIIMDLPGNKEPISYFQDQLSAPGIYNYEISTIDGYGRRGTPTVFTVAASDWRRPSAPKSAASTLDVILKGRQVKQTNLLSMTPALSAPNARKDIVIGWQSQSTISGQQIRYNIYKYDLDNPDMAPEKVTSAPIAGVPIPFETEAQFLIAADQIFGKEYIDEQEKRISDAEAFAKTAPASEQRNAAIQLAKVKARVSAERKALQNLWQNNPPLSFTYSTTVKDKKYAFSVTSIFLPSNLESGETPAGTINLPDFSKPLAPTRPSLSFAANARSGQVFSAPPKTSASFSNPSTPFSGTSVGGSSGISGIGSPVLAQSGIRFFNAKKFAPLRLQTADNGGKVTIKWESVPGLIEPLYSIKRKVGDEPFVEIGLSEPGAKEFVDTVPRTRARTYVYQISTISRWNIKGNPVEVSIAVPATIAPEQPNLLSVRPGADKQLVLKLATPPADQSVTKITILRDGREVGSINNPQATTTTVEFLDNNLDPQKSYRYQAKAETTGGIASPLCPELTGSPLQQSVGAPTNLQVTSTTRGVQLTWVAPAGATAFVVKRKTGNEEPEILTSDLSTSSYLDFQAFPGNTYEYSVVAIDANGNVSNESKRLFSVP